MKLAVSWGHHTEMQKITERKLDLCIPGYLSTYGPGQFYLLSPVGKHEAGEYLLVPLGRLEQEDCGSAWAIGWNTVLKRKEKAALQNSFAQLEISVWRKRFLSVARPPWMNLICLIWRKSKLANTLEVLASLVLLAPNWPHLDFSRCCLRYLTSVSLSHNCLFLTCVWCHCECLGDISICNTGFLHSWNVF